MLERMDIGEGWEGVFMVVLELIQVLLGLVGAFFVLKFNVML